MSLDPLLIYISNFVHPAEAAALIDLGTPLLEPSPISSGGSDSAGHQARTSWSAPLPMKKSSVVECILARAQHLLGTALLAPGRDDMGKPQMVRYTAGQKFDLHTDWFARPRITDEDARDQRRRMYNRVGTIFVVLQANCSDGGETWFPYVTPGLGVGDKTDEQRQLLQSKAGGGLWRMHEDGGLAFKPIPGNAIFWVNMYANGTGDRRTLHAGLPIKDGVKTAMNIWPRTFFGPDA
jgi:prolyl 4-hydroxylase